MVDSLGAPPAHCPDHPDCFNVPSYLSAWFSETGFPMLTSLLHATPTDDSPPGTTPVPFANTVDLPPSHPTPTGGITPNAFNTKTPEVITETESAFDDPGPTDDSLQGPTPVTNNKEASEDLTATETEGATSAALTSTPQLTQTEGVGASNAQATDGSSGQFNSNATGRKQTRTSSSTDDIQSSPLESTPFVNAAPGPTQSTSTEDTAEDENFNTEAFTPTSSSTPKGQKHSTSASSRTTTSPPFTSQSLSPTDAPTLSFSSSSSLLTSSPSPTATAFTSPAPAKSNNKMVPIVAGAVVPAVLLLFGATALFLYKRRQRARDRREWERTHAEIADAVRQVGGPATRMPSWSRGHSSKDSVLP
ncbi:hypothetical protein C8R46DRAFT_1236077 [Mycena filopes]|nr:hypothetical protein C8R46DRAFT_1236077 [Mycena filopes]